MSFVNQGSQPAAPSTLLSGIRRPKDTSRCFTPWSWRLFFLVFLAVFYAIELLWIGPVDGINDDWGMYSTPLLF